MTKTEINNKAKWVLLFLITFYIGCSVAIAQKPSNANYYELSYKLNTPKSYGKTVDIIGTVVKKHKTSNKGITAYFVMLTNHNTTYKVEVLEKYVWMLIEDRQNLVLKNCIIISLKQ